MSTENETDRMTVGSRAARRGRPGIATRAIVASIAGTISRAFGWPGQEKEHGQDA